ncbi:DUF58 domain-containing protein [Desulfurococcus mucosus]|uniref:DUF58 domain-containing protein n=1 Tax=Desulfurococcus mucosus (strain ATCC 35584 / DSM 2162 / JCM 9187 / O7/1) TaxID=765177 RepID=E8R835_DESM0|nr:DUF58 domain-containing protein [Desulfurococcus mucosus]ADV64661.1 protein of unknown function DUF58 [Desulfurococcus mucosus DSM 2162]
MPVSATPRLKLYVLFTSLLLAVAILVDPAALTLALILLALPILSHTLIEVGYSVLEKLRVSESVRVEKDGRVVVEYMIENPSRIPLLPVEYSVAYSELLRLAEGVKAGLLLVPPRGVVKLRLVFHGRLGEHTVGPVRAVLRDPFGFYRSSEETLGKAVTLNIPPVPEEVVVRRLFRYARSTGLVKSKAPGDGVEFYDVRDYFPGDEMKRIVWRVYASRRTLAVWEPEREVYQPVVFILDATREMWSGPFGQSMVEHSARITASLIHYLTRRGYPVSTVVFNESVTHASGRPIHGYRGYMESLRTISRARLSWEGTLQRRSAVSSVLSYTYERILPRDRSIVFLFTHLDEDVLGDVASWNSIYSARGHVLYIVHPLITSYDTGNIPEWAANVYRVKLMEALRRDIDVLSRARSMGLRVVAVTPSLIPQRVVDIVERYSA